MAHKEKHEKRDEGKEFRSHAYAERYAEVGMSTAWQGWVNGVLGLWLVVVALIGLSTSMSTLIVTGVLVAIVGFWAAIVRTSLWQQWVNGILGLWVIVIPFLALALTPLAWTVGITGLIIAILGFWATGRGRMS